MKTYLENVYYPSSLVRSNVATDRRWQGIRRPYQPEDVERLRGSFCVEYTLARKGAERLWHLLQTEEYLPALGALTGNQAVQQVKAGLKAIYLSGWQVAADANLSGQMYPDQSLYPANSVPAVVKRINQALLRADQICHHEGKNGVDWMAPIVADAEAGFGGPLNVFELVKAMIEAGAAGVHLEDQLASEKKCGHMGGKVLIPTQQAICHLTARRLLVLHVVGQTDVDKIQSDAAVDGQCQLHGIRAEIPVVDARIRSADECFEIVDANLWK